MSEIESMNGTPGNPRHAEWVWRSREQAGRVVHYWDRPGWPVQVQSVVTPIEPMVFHLFLCGRHIDTQANLSAALRMAEKVPVETVVKAVLLHLHRLDATITEIMHVVDSSSTTEGRVLFPDWAREWLRSVGGPVGSLIDPVEDLCADAEISLDQQEQEKREAGR